MKKVIFFSLLMLLVFLCASFALQAQSSGRNSSISVTFSGLGQNTALHWEDINGAGSYSGRGYYSFGITFVRSLSNRFDLGTGIEFINSTFRFSNASLGPDNIPHQTNFSLIEIPVTARFNFWQYFFLNGGLLLGFDITQNRHLHSQTGVGAMLGVGARYDFNSLPIGLFLNPYLKYRPLIPFAETGNFRWRTAEAGFRFGVVYSF